MKLLISLDELKNYKSRDKTVPVECQCCKETFYTTKSTAQTALSDKKRERLKFCSRKCSGKAINTQKTLPCELCGKVVIRKQRDIGVHTFCSSSCCATYYNTHKTSGFNRSKLEIWLESKLTSMYPDIHVLYNDRKTLGGLELDIYVPKYKLAFELNGIFHYEPIFGKNQLEKTQVRDVGKFQRCIELEISLCVIDTTSVKYFKEHNSEKFLTIITNIINSKMAVT